VGLLWVEEEERLWVVVHLLYQVLNLGIVLNHVHLSKVLLETCTRKWLKLCQRPQVEQITILAYESHWRVLCRSLDQVAVVFLCRLCLGNG